MEQMKKTNDRTLERAVVCLFLLIAVGALLAQYIMGTVSGRLTAVGVIAMAAGVHIVATAPSNSPKGEEKSCGTTA